jgi:hypothetical protein
VPKEEKKKPKTRSIEVGGHDGHQVAKEIKPTKEVKPTKETAV